MKLSKGSFQPEKEVSFDKETSRGMEESRNLMGVKENKEPPLEALPISNHGLNQKEAPVLGPATVAEGHQPTPVAGIAKPKAKGRKLPKAVT